MIDNNEKEGVHKQDTIGLDGRGIQGNSHGSVETVTVERRVNHEHTHCHGFTIEHVPIKRKNSYTMKCNKEDIPKI